MSTRFARGIWVVGGAGLLAAWLAAAASDRAPQPAHAPASGPSPLDRAEQVAREIEAQSSRMRARLASAPRPQDSGRNPFLFEQRRTLEPAAGVRLLPLPAAAGGTEPAGDAVVEPLPFTLNGIAEDGTGESAIRTAVLSGLGDIFLVRAGDTFADRYEVLAIDAASVELKDLTSGRRLRLSLR